MRTFFSIGALVVMILCIGGSVFGQAAPCGPGPCVPERPIPPESVGTISLPFDVPVWPTLLKTEFNIMPWLNFDRIRVCLPMTGRTIEFPAPHLSLKPIPIWIPWLRPLDAEFPVPRH
jgi:hypothetical protein